MNRNRWPLLVVIAAVGGALAMLLSSPSVVAQSSATQTKAAQNTATAAALDTQNAAIQQTAFAGMTQSAATQTKEFEQTATAASPTPSNTPTFTSTPTPTNTRTPTPSNTPTRTAIPTFTPAPTATPLGTAAPDAHWEWPVCGDVPQRGIATYFDHYYSTWQSFGLDSGLTRAGDGVGLIAPYNADVCHSYDIGFDTWCQQIVAGRSDQSSLTEFQAIAVQPPVMPDGLVVAPHAARVMWTGLTTRSGYEQGVGDSLCRVGGWQYGMTLGFHSDEYVTVSGLVGTSVRAEDVLAQGDVLGAGTSTVSYGDPATVRTAPLRAAHTRWGSWFDPLGWGEDRYDTFAPYDRGLDPNYQRGNIPSQRRIDPLVATGPACLSACTSTRYIVDDSDSGFLCDHCSDPIDGSEGYGGSYRSLEPTGDDAETATASWAFPAAGPGVYSVYAWLGWMVDADADGVPDIESSPAARYRAGSTTFLASQKADGPATAGWYYIGTFDYATAPYIALSNAAYSDQLHPAMGYIDSATCGRLYVDAVAFVSTCSSIVSPAVAGTVAPAVTATPNCATMHCGTP